ncbi:MAG: hypothetical protein K0M70_01585 [Arenimonas sp.]|uniref:hypothetical protein n=1 Tax=Arenimonas sp. TaxID=1872635 RepID=UPI0025BF6987|nr:hypothetical protein [Arenimonas sp.]MBW8366540.1 hypothetical protein [Arenimonas sp.]
MLRTLLALLLAVAATGALGAEVLPAEAEAPQCEKDADQAGKSTPGAAGSTTAARPGTPASVRPRSASGRSTPRWHSLLPGMIR